MPKEHRKRGKKKKPEPEWQPPLQELHIPEPEPITEQQAAGPSWIVPGPNAEDDVNPEAPFGYVDVDVKAYFRTVDVQIRDWQDNAIEPGANEDNDPNEGAFEYSKAAASSNKIERKTHVLCRGPD